MASLTYFLNLLIRSLPCRQKHCSIWQMIPPSISIINIIDETTAQKDVKVFFPRYQ